MSYNVQNYTEQSGKKTVIGGELVINGKLSASENAEIEGVTPVAANQSASVATTVELLVTDFNALLTKLKTAGLMAADAVTTPTPEPPAEENVEDETDDQEDAEPEDDTSEEPDTE